jgi:myo-inositol-1(or 4)-monophosphatase
MTTGELRALAESVSREAGALLRDAFYGPELRVSVKSTPTDLVSEADLAAERAIRAILAARVPGDAVMGEEGEDTPGTSGRRWIVDPLDGTVNYLYGLPLWAVSVACEGVVGVVFDPVRGELFAAAADGPATLNDEPLTARPAGTLDQALVATGFGYDPQRRTLQAEVVARVLPRARDIRRGGSAALDMAWCAAGRLDAYYERGINPWDVAAGELICARAGLVVQRLDPLGALPWGIMAAPPAFAGELRDLIAS